VSKKKLVRAIGVCITGILIIVAVTVFPSCQSQTPPGYGLQFDGVDDRVDCESSSAALNVTDAITIEAWVRGVGNIGWSTIVGREHSTRWQVDYALMARNDGTNQIYMFGMTDSNGNKWDSGSYSISIDSEWHHLAGTFDGSHLMLYLDGGLVKTKDTGAPRNIATSGYTLLMGGYFGQMLNATISEVHIWNIARTEEQIQADMYKKMTGTESGLVGYWKLDEGSGTIANDSTPNNNDGTLLGGPVWVGGGG
jgi:hypothetical protein